MTRALTFAAASLVFSLAGCAIETAQPPADPIVITPQTNAALSAYLRAVKVTRPGAFAVSPDGRNSFYTYCETLSCVVANYSVSALRDCQSLTGTPCLLLYVRDEPRLAFTRGDKDLPGRHGSKKQPEADFEQHGR